MPLPNVTRRFLCVSLRALICIYRKEPRLLFVRYRQQSRIIGQQSKSPRPCGRGLCFGAMPPYLNCTFTKMMTSVKSDSDSMNARPSVSSSRMPGRAPGLRASASVAEAVARP